MAKQVKFAHNDVTFSDSLPGVKTELLQSMLPYDFPGKKFFTSFYSRYNGGYFDGGAYFYREDIYTLKTGEHNLLEIESFNFIPYPKNQQHPRLMSVSEILDLRKTHHRLNPEFYSIHIPFAGDAGDNDFWIDIVTGAIKYTRTEELSETPNTILVAPNFHIFCDSIRGSRKLI